MNHKVKIRNVQVGDYIKTVPSAEWREVLNVDNKGRGLYTIHFSTGVYSVHGQSHVYKKV